MRMAHTANVELCSFLLGASNIDSSIEVISQY